MITLLVALVGGSILGFMAGRPTEKRERCGAWIDTQWTKNGYNECSTKKQGRCPERCDPRCQAGHCTLHCRAADRCNGACLKEVA